MTDTSSADRTRRFRRLHRSQVARLLVSIAGQRPESDLSAIDWDAIAETPGWCLLSRADIERTCLLAGGLFMAPRIRGWIDGRRLQTLLALLGNPALDAVLDAGDAAPIVLEAWDDEPSYDAGQLRESLSLAGQAILLAAVRQPLVRQLLALHLLPPDASVDLPAVDADLAERLALQAMQLLLAEQTPVCSAPDTDAGSCREALACNS